MINLVEIDENVRLTSQLEEEEGKEDGGHSVMINKFNIKPEDVPELLKAWAADAAHHKQTPGFISTQLHRSIGRSCVFINYTM